MSNIASSLKKDILRTKDKDIRIRTFRDIMKNKINGVCRREEKSRH